MENTYLNLRRGQIQNLFPVRLPCRCETFSNPRYNLELDFRVGHEGKWVKNVKIECVNCGTSITHNVEWFKVFDYEIKF